MKEGNFVFRFIYMRRRRGAQKTQRRTMLMALFGIVARLFGAPREFESQIHRDSRSGSA